MNHHCVHKLFWGWAELYLFYSCYWVLCLGIISVCFNWIKLVVTIGPPHSDFAWGTFSRASMRSWWDRKLVHCTTIPGHHLLRIVVLEGLNFAS